MKTRFIVGIVAAIIIVFLGVIFVNIVSNNLQLPFFSSQPPATVTISGHTFHAKIARSEKEKEIGLSNTLSLPQDQGMLFVFSKPDYYAFWMRNMHYPLDIIYIANKKIISIAENASTPSNPTQSLPVYKPSVPADTVLEISGGLSTKYHFAPGDSVVTSL